MPKNQKPISKGVKIALICIVTAIAAAALAIGLVFLLQKELPVLSDGLSSFSHSNSSMQSAISSEEEPKDNGIRLKLSAPEKQNITVTQPEYTFKGSCDVLEPLTLNGEAVECDENGNFSIKKELKIGKNTFTFSHKGENKTYTVNYRYVVLKSYTPNGKQMYPCGSSFTVTVTARKGSKVTASFNGKKLTLGEKGASDSDFQSFSGSFTLPDNNIRNVNLGNIKFQATQNGITETFYSGNITCKKPDTIVDFDPDATPSDEKYINVGSGLIAEVIHFSAETFDAYDTGDKSSPLNNYLPEGTVDYVAQERVYHKSGSRQREYAVLRYGKQVYTYTVDNPTDKKIPIIKEYVGTLPDHNEITALPSEETERFTTLKFGCLWKAPFYFELLPQRYENVKNQNFSVSSVTASYVDITFCYATVFDGEFSLSGSNPLFKSAKIIRNQSDFTLRLYLKKQGCFYGWDAYYDKDGNICFEFLHPAKVSAADNIYGVDLSGVKIVVDAGHNGTGVDVGALGLKPSTNHEAERNLYLARLIRNELNKTGATVIMTRNSAVSNITYQQRIKLIKTQKPDYCISVHHNSSTSASPNGFGSFYSTLFSKNAAEYIYMRTFNTGVYKKIEKLSWHYFFLARTTNCPIVLTENGYISNKSDFSTIISEKSNQKKAEAIVQGIADYFMSLSK